MPRVVALDLGAFSVKVSVYQSQGRRSVLEGHYERLVPQDGSVEPSLAQRLVALDELLVEHPGWASPANDIALVWPTEYASIRRVDLPFADRAQVEKTLPFAIESDVPFDLDEMVLAWRPLPTDTGTRAFVVMVRQTHLREWVSALASRGLDPKAVHLDAELLGRWARADEITAVLDIGHTHTELSVCVQGRVVAVRSMNVGGWMFTRAIQHTLGVSFDEAADLKHGPRPDADGALTSLPEPSRDAVNAAMGLLLAEVRSSLIAVEDELGIEVGRVALTGGGARLDPLGGYLAEDLGLPVRRVVDAAGETVPAGFANTFALALEVSQGGDRERVLDLRVGDLAYKGGVNILRAVMVYGSAALTFFLIATVVMFVVQYRSLSTEQAELEARIMKVVTDTLPGVSPSALRNTTTAMAILSEQTSAAVSRSGILADASAVPPTVDKMRALTKAFPPPDQIRVEVSDLRITPNTITFTAETDGYATAAGVEEALKKVPQFKDAAKSGDRKVRDKVSFSVTIPLLTDDGEEG